LTIKTILFTALVLYASASTYAKKTLRIESDPPGAKVEIAGEFYIAAKFMPKANFHASPSLT